MRNGRHLDSDGTESWYENGQLHRDGGPALIHPDGSEEWYYDGQLHREDGPAISHQDGMKGWLLNGFRHREDGPALVYPDGSEEWYYKGLLHREDGPAIVTHGKVSYFFMGDYCFECKKRTDKSDHRFKTKIALRVIDEVNRK